MKVQSSTISGRSRLLAFSLVELMISLTIWFIVIGAIVALIIISTQNFAATANYVQLNDQSRYAVDIISREIRNATALMDYGTNNPKYILLTNANFGTATRITHYYVTNAPDEKTNRLVLTRTSEPDKTLLTGCESFSFSFFTRAPIIATNNISFGTPTNFISGKIDPQFCKIINLNWKCTRSILGSKLNTEVVQTAQVVLRNQVSE